MTGKLGTYKTRFWNLVAASERGAFESMPAKYPGELVTELLNAAWSSVATETGGLTVSWMDTLTSGQENYEVPDNIIRVYKVELLRNSEIYATLYPVDPTAWERKDGADDDGTPTVCTFKLQYRLGNEAKNELRLYPAPNWTETNGIWVTAAAMPAFIDDDASYPDMRDTLAEAGLYLAAANATLDPRLRALYREELARYYRSGADNRAGVVRNPWGRNGIRRDYNSYARGS